MFLFDYFCFIITDQIINESFWIIFFRKFFIVANNFFLLENILIWLKISQKVCCDNCAFNFSHSRFCLFLLSGAAIYNSFSSFSSKSTLVFYTQIKNQFVVSKQDYATQPVCFLLKFIELKFTCDIVKGVIMNYK